MAGIIVSFWDGLVSGAMLVSVSYCKQNHEKIDLGCLGGGFQYVFFHPELGKFAPIWLAHIFQMGGKKPATSCA